MLSSEDTAWVDSCLVKDSGLSDGSWNSLKDALLDILSSQPGSHSDSLAERYGFTRGSEIYLPTSEEAGTAQFARGTDDDHVPNIEESEIAQFPGGNSDNLPMHKKALTTQFRDYFQKDFLLSYPDMEENDDTDIGVDLGSTNEMECSAEDIFRVWNLDTPVEEEDELIKQLEMALAESSLRAVTLNLDFSGTHADSNEMILDDLAAGIADMSLH